MWALANFINLTEWGMPLPNPEILKSTIIVRAERKALFYKQMYTLLIYQYLHSGTQVETLHNSSQSRWLPQLCFLSNQNSLWNSTTLIFQCIFLSYYIVWEWMLTAHLYSSISSTSNYTSTDSTTPFLYLQHPTVKVSKAQASIITVFQQGREISSSNSNPLKPEPQVF